MDMSVPRRALILLLPLSSASHRYKLRIYELRNFVAFGQAGYGRVLQYLGSLGKIILNARKTIFSRFIQWLERRSVFVNM